MNTIVRLILAAVLGAIGILAAAVPPASAALAPGIVLSSSTATLPAELSALATGKRIQYTSTSITGSTITATGLVMTPKAGKKNKIVAWAHGTTGLADQCAPSTNQAVFWEEARIAVAELLSRGWTVAATDYPGLGTVLPHPYLIGASEGRAIIDSVKAARNLDPSLSTQYAIDGHSQGGQGALFASQLAPSYDGNLVLKGTSSIAPVSNTDTIVPLIPGTPGQGYLVMALFGLATVDSSVQPLTILAAPAKAKLGVLSSGCLNEILAAYQDLTASQLVVGGTVPDAVLAKFAQYDNPAQTAPSAPILVVQGTDDDAVPYFVTADLLIPQLEAYSQPVTFVPIEGATHDTSVILSADLVADWIAARFA
ncbi:pimeloyl-ACP methyl ester carboxylesterase [Actinoplanes octamycinicus]|uniref:Pimeloyl-ACP methyl ester carboxylesterase n=1 Tax=Actinoplanes octamycinicus TaxID=135948 RepID=A0A7W7M8L1_9ACTN|nr:alpha/beta fold hydrolase [Actinoplanes octamycinicus]MBB4741047.1 pimeloyl-ACP methyl ester carboxylesterase [Actinoplanes octamycinicus]GIE55952.1 lipase [Actinoplanes octamycinicus]